MWLWSVQFSFLFWNGEIRPTITITTGQDFKEQQQLLRLGNFYSPILEQNFKIAPNFIVKFQICHFTSWSKLLCIINVKYFAKINVLFNPISSCFEETCVMHSPSLVCGADFGATVLGVWECCSGSVHLIGRPLAGTKF